MRKNISVYIANEKKQKKKNKIDTFRLEGGVVVKENKRENYKHGAFNMQLICSIKV